MTPRETLASCRDVAVDAYNAGRVALAQLIANVDEKLANAINGGEDE